LIKTLLLREHPNTKSGIALNKKTVFVFIMIILIVAIPISLYFQTTEKNNIEPSEPNVKITDFVVDNQWNYLGGLVFDRSFKLTIENKGADNVTDLQLKVRIYSNNSEVQVGNYFFGTYENGTITQPLGAYEVREFKGTLMTIVGEEAYRLDFASNETSIIAMVLLNNTVLDERPFA
jgi:hypothetical protein